MGPPCAFWSRLMGRENVLFPVLDVAGGRGGIWSLLPQLQTPQTGSKTEIFSTATPLSFPKIGDILRSPS